MTSVFTTRQTPEGKNYQVVVPASRAEDSEFANLFAQLAREFLYRQGVAVHHIPDELLLWQITNTFRDHRSALETGTISLGEITT